jgi:hypothetical protein
MPTPPIDQRTFAFIVKVWWERRDIEGAPLEWRGSVDDVQSGQRRYFLSMRELCGYLQQHTSTNKTAGSWRERVRKLLRR